jgi:hypothetical protein
MGPLMPMLPDGGIYDPESGLSFTGFSQTNEFMESTPGVTIDGYSTDSPSVAPSIVTTPTTSPTTTPPIVPIPIITPTVTSTPAITSVITTSTPGTSATDKRNAREFLIASLKPYFASSEDTGFLSQLEGIIDNYVKQDYDIETISVLLPQSAPYKERFKGNVARTASGLVPLTPAEYLQAETQYNEILKRFSLGDLAKRDTFTSLIGGQVSAAELTDRVVNVYDRIRNADPALRAELNRLASIGDISDVDFVKALLTGTEGANELKRKITTAEISAEARTRGLSVTSAEQLQQRGITREQASAGFEQIRLTQPTMEKLSDIYRRDLTPTTPEGNIARTQEFQTELEREQFGGLASERRRRLAEQEQTAFMGQSGTAAGVSLGRRRRGQF